MKNLSLILNAVLIIAVALLYFIVFSSKQQNLKTQDQVHKSTTKDATTTSKTSIVYVNTDSLLTKYQLAIDLNDQLIKKQKMSKANLEAKAASFEKEAAAFQEKVQRNGFLSQQSAEAQQQELMQKQQNLQQLEYDLTNQLGREQQDLNRQLYDSIVNFLRIYNETYNYQFILGHTPGGGLLYANENLDITDTIIKALNSRYTVSKKK